MNKSRPTIKSEGFNFIDDLQRLFRKRGTASYPVTFVDDEGNRYHRSSIKVASTGNGETIIPITKEVKVDY